MPETWAVLLPFKGPLGSKTRLGLETAQRQALSRDWLQHVIECCEAAAGVGQITVVSLAPLDLPARVSGWVQSKPGLNEGLEEARQHLGLQKLVVILPDLPFVRADEIQGLLDLCPAGGIALAPDRHESGTNGLAVHGARAFRFAFGADSLQRHQQQAQSLQLPSACWRSPGFGHDVDTDADLEGLTWRTA